MRYVVFAAMGIVSLVLCGSFFGYATIAGLVPDLILLIALCILLNEHSAMAIVFAVIFGLLFDDLFSPALGGNALAYTISVAIIFISLKKVEHIRVWTPAIVGFSAYIIKELIIALIVFAMGTQFDLFYMFYRFILTGALLTAGLMIPAYYLMRWLYSFPWMRPRRTYDNGLDL